jgi:hypothetical protein
MTNGVANFRHNIQDHLLPAIERLRKAEHPENRHVEVSLDVLHQRRSKLHLRLVRVLNETELLMGAAADQTVLRALQEMHRYVADLLAEHTISNGLPDNFLYGISEELVRLCIPLPLQEPKHLSQAQ